MSILHLIVRMNVFSIAAGNPELADPLGIIDFSKAA